MGVLQWYQQKNSNNTTSKEAIRDFQGVTRDFQGVSSNFTGFEGGGGVKRGLNSRVLKGNGHPV